MKKSELQQIIKEEISKVINEEQSSMSPTQERLLNDLYRVIKEYTSALSDEQIINTLSHLSDIYSEEN